LDPAHVGLYALGVMVAESLWQISNAAALALLPRVARTWENGGERGAAFTCSVLRQVFMLSSILALGIALLSPWVIPVVFGAAFQPSISVIWWLLPGTVALAVGKVMSADLTARGKPEYSSIFAAATLLVTVILDVILIPRMGIQGAALASSAAYLFDTGLIALVLRRHLDVSWKALMVPSRGDIAVYGNVWRRLQSGLAGYFVVARQ
jgi:O-antigen/teichoic acid export membrane protein